MSSISNTLPDTPASVRGKGKHVTTACLGCRRRKIKCDGVTPRCSNCVLYDQECVFQHGVDKRKIAPKERLQALTDYCHQLENLLLANGFSLPAPPPLHVQNAYGGPHSNLIQKSDPSLSQTASLSSAHPGLGAYGWPGEQAAPPALERNHVEANANQANRSNSNNNHAVSFMADDNDFDENYAFSESSPEQAIVENAQANVVPKSNPESDSELLLDQLSGRMGSLQIAEDGQLRFYGATSNLHILHNGPLSLSRSKFRSPSEQGTDLLRGAGVGHVVEDDIEDHLLKLYLAWEDPSIHVVEESVFWRERMVCKAGGHASSLYSEVLTNAMCSIGATLTSRRYPHLPDPLPDFFATRAKLLLELEMDAPTLSTVQSLVILSAIEALLTRDARGWLDSGMAVRLAVDLGLHLDPEPYVRAGLISEEEGLVRRMIWGGVFVHDRMWSLYVGRPVALDDKNITVQLVAPKNSTNGTRKYWLPYDDTDGLELQRVEDPIEELSTWNAKLCWHMTAIRENLYSDRLTEPKGARDLFRFASEIRERLLNWLNTLPSSLVADDLDNKSYLPHVLQLHMQFHCVMVITYRPFFASVKTLPGLSPEEVANSRNVCTESANAVAHLIQTYRRLYTLRRINVQAVHLIFTATLIHVFTACAARDKVRSENAWKNLEICCQALSEMGLAFKNASRALEVIMGIKSDLLRRPRAKPKRQNPWSDTHEAEVAPPKRRRPTNAEGELLHTQQSPQSQGSSSFDPNLTDVNETFNFFDTDTAFDDFSLDTLFWSGFNNLELPHYPPHDP